MKFADVVILATMILVGSTCFAQEIDKDAEACKTGQAAYKTVGDVFRQKSAQGLTHASQSFARSQQSCLTEPKDKAMTPEQVEQLKTGNQMVDQVKIGQARARWAADQMKSRAQDCAKAHQDFRSALERDNEELEDRINQKKAALQAAAADPAAAATIQEEIRQADEARLQGQQIYQGLYGDVAKSAFTSMTKCYERTAKVYDAAERDYARSLGYIAAESPQDLGQQLAARPSDEDNRTLMEKGRDSAIQMAKDKAIEKPISAVVERGTKTVLTAGSDFVSRAATGAVTRAPAAAGGPIGMISSLAGSMVVPDPNPGGACSAGPTSDPMLAYRRGCFTVQSVNSAIKILGAP